MTTPAKQIARLKARKAELEQLISLQREVASLESRLLMAKDSTTKAARVVTECVCAHFKLSPDVINSRNRQDCVAWPRMVAWYVLRTLTPATMAQIGRLFQRDHGTILHGVRCVTERIEREPTRRADVRAMVDACRRAMETPNPAT